MSLLAKLCALLVVLLVVSGHVFATSSCVEEVRDLLTRVDARLKALEQDVRMVADNVHLIRQRQNLAW